MRRHAMVLTGLLVCISGGALRAQGPVVQPLVATATQPLDGLAATAEVAPNKDEDLVAPYGHAPHRYVQADMLFWNRVGTGCDQALVEDFITGARVMSVGDLSSFRYEPGVRLTVGARPDPCHGGWCSAWEATYFGIFDWSASAAVAEPTDTLVPPGLGVGVAWNLPPNGFEAFYDSELHSVELNCIKTCCLFACSKGDVKTGGLYAHTQLDVLCGFRFISLQEDFLLRKEGDITLGEVGTYDISTDNYLYGVQLGGRLRRNYGLWEVEMRGKAGVFVNDARQRQAIVHAIPAGEVLRATRGSGQSPAALGELGITATRHLNRTWSIRGGYDAMGLGGLALAPDQLDWYLEPVEEAGTGLHKTGWVFVHGAHVGLEARW